MKSKKFLLSILLTAPLFVFAQPDAVRQVNYYPFTKNYWGFPLQKNIDFGRTTDLDDDGNKLGHSTDFGLSFEKTYFIARSLGLSLDYCMNWWCEGDESERDWTGKLGVVYGTRLSDRLNFYGEAGGILGNIREKQGNNIDKYGRSGYYAEIGLPIYLESTVFFTPRINWSHIVTDYDDGKETKNGFGFSVGLESYMPFSAVMCDHHKDFALSKDKYRQGNNYINFQTMGNVRFGNSETEYDNTQLTSEYDYSGFRIGAHYSYYVIDGLALGAKINYSNRTQEFQNNENSNSRFSISPRVTLNPFKKTCYNNWFFETGVGIGSSKTEYRYGTITNEVKYNNFYVGAWTGYNLFFTERLALTPQAGYKWATQENTDTDVKTKSRRLDAEIGINFNF